MDITQLLNSDLGKQIVSGIGGQTGTSEAETSSVVNAAGPVLLGMLHKNASSEEGAAGILGALGKHDGSILDNLSGFFGAGGDAADGDGILGHVLGGNRSSVESAISKQTGVGASKVSAILAMLAPIIMGYLGKQAKSSGGVQGSGGLGDILGNLLGGSGNSSVGGSILSSILGGGGSKSGGGLGGLLGGLFGKK